MMEKIRAFREGIAQIYGDENILPSQHSVYGHGVLQDIKEGVTRHFWETKK